ncbi:MAG: Lrp/AsnC ligand binding domain-containing protein [Pseudomonadota bacterium]
MNETLDQIDRRILATLAADGRITITRLAERVGLSKTPCQLRVKRLEADGYILGYQALLAPEKLDRAHVAFVEVKLSSTTGTALGDFNRAILRLPMIEQCHMIAGHFDYLLKVRTRDIADYRRFLAEEISRLPHVAQTSTYVSMEAVKEPGQSPPDPTAPA